MKKHILSKYGEIKKNEKNNTVNNGPTKITESCESTDEDSFVSKSVLFNIGPTLFTKSIESSDPDEFLSLQDPTNLTFTKETTDEDSYVPSFV